MCECPGCIEEQKRNGKSISPDEMKAIREGKK